MTSANDLLMGGGAGAAKFDRIGDSVSGRISVEPEVQQQTDLNTGEPKFWADGSPRQQIKVTLATDQRDPADPYDDGARAVYVRGQMLKATREAIRAAGAPGLQVGGTLTVTYVADGEVTKRGYNPPKQYEVQYAPPASAAANSVLMGGSQQPPAAPAPQVAVAQQPPAPASAAPAAPARTPEQEAALAALTPEQRAALGL